MRWVWLVRVFVSFAQKTMRYIIYGTNFSYVSFVSMSIISIKWMFAVMSLQLFFGAHFFVDHLLPEVASCKNHTEMFRVVDFLLKYDYEA